MSIQQQQQPKKKKKQKKKKEIAGEQEVHYERPNAIAIDQVHDPLLPIIYSEDFIAL